MMCMSDQMNGVFPGYRDLKLRKVDRKAATHFGDLIAGIAKPELSGVNQPCLDDNVLT